MNPDDGAKFLIGLLVFAAVMFCVYLVLGMFPLPYPFPTIILIIFGLIALGYLLRFSNMWPGGKPPTP